MIPQFLNTFYVSKVIGENSTGIHDLQSRGFPDRGHWELQVSLGPHQSPVLAWFKAERLRKNKGGRCWSESDSKSFENKQINKQINWVLWNLTIITVKISILEG